MLTSSTNDIDLERANNFKCVEGYFPKPMDKETMRMILSS
jgi:hypothetical protein